MDAKTIMHTDEPSPELLAWPEQPPAKHPPAKQAPTQLPLGLMTKPAPLAPPILAATIGKSPPPSHNMALHVQPGLPPTKKSKKMKSNMEEADRAQGFLLPARGQPGRIPPHPSLAACLAEMSVMSSDEIDRRVADLSPFSEETESEG